MGKRVDCKYRDGLFCCKKKCNVQRRCVHVHCIPFALISFPLYCYSYRWPAICIHGDKAQQEREWVLGGKSFCVVYMLKLLC